NHAVYHQLPGLVQLTDPDGSPIRVEDMEDGHFWVVDIHTLHDKGQRMVFLSLIDRLTRLLEAKRIEDKETVFYKGGEKVDLTHFPDKVIVFVDELNKFAPGTVARAPL